MSRGKISDLFFEIGYRVNPTGLNKANNELKKIKNNANAGGLQLGKLGASLNGLATAVLPLMSIGAALGFVTNESLKSINVISEFDDKLRVVVSKLGANKEQLRELSPVTRQVARDYHVMANSVAEAQDYLALAGYSLEEIKKGTESVVAAQKATGESMKLVSDIATDTASAYGYSAEGLEFITDRMVYTTTKFNTGFAQMGEAMKYVAPIAKQAGLEFEDLSAYIGVIANSGIKGSQAGTALRMAFLRLQAPTKMAENQLKRFKVSIYDNKGEFLGINKVMRNMEKAMETMTDKQKAMFMQQVFGTESMSAMNIVFKEGVDNIIAYGDAISQADGKTKEMATFMEQGLGGVRRSVEAEKEALSLVLGEALEPAAISFLTHIKNGLQFLREDLEINHETKSDLAMGFAEIFGQASKIGMAVLYDIPETVDFLTGGLISYLGRRTKEKNEETETQNQRLESPYFPELQGTYFDIMAFPKISEITTDDNITVEVSANPKLMTIESKDLIKYDSKNMELEVSANPKLMTIESKDLIKYDSENMELEVSVDPKFKDISFADFINSDFQNAELEVVVNPTLRNIDFKDLDKMNGLTPLLKLPSLENVVTFEENKVVNITGEHYYKEKEIVNSGEKKEITINIKIDGTDTLGRDVATAISEEVQKSFEEAMNYELLTTNINLGRGFSY